MCMLSGVGLGGMLVQRARRNRDRPAHSCRRDKILYTIYHIILRPSERQGTPCNPNNDISRY